VLPTLALAGCGGGPAPATFDLNAPRTGYRTGGRGRAILLVQEPTALQAYDSERIVVKTEAGSISYLTGAQWSDRLPRLLQSRIIQAFENSGRAGAVGRPGQRLQASLQLASEIRAFELQAGSREAVIELSIKLVDDRTGTIRAAQLVSGRAPAEAINGAQGTAALDRALAAMLLQLVPFVNQRG
jgi:cholesterol transport system auxiliary component